MKYISFCINKAIFILCLHIFFLLFREMHVIFDLNVLMNLSYQIQGNCIS